MWQLLSILMNKQECGQFIRERRGDAENQPETLAELAGVVVHTISNLETGKENCTVETLLKVAQMLGYAVRVGT